MKEVPLVPPKDITMYNNNQPTRFSKEPYYRESGKHKQVGGDTLASIAVRDPKTAPILHMSGIITPTMRNPKTKEGVLHEAVKYHGDLGPLLKLGYQSMHRDKRGHTPFHTAVEADNDRAVKQMLDAGLGTPHVLNKQREGDGKTALHLAAEQGDEALCRLLIEYGADIGIKTKDTKQTAEQLFLAIHKEPLQIERSNGYLPRDQRSLQVERIEKPKADLPARRNAVSTGSVRALALEGGFDLLTSSETDLAEKPQAKVNLPQQPKVLWYQKLSSAVTEVVKKVTGLIRGKAESYTLEPVEAPSTETILEKSVPVKDRSGTKPFSPYPNPTKTGEASKESVMAKSCRSKNMATEEPAKSTEIPNVPPAVDTGKGR